MSSPEVIDSSESDAESSETVVSGPSAKKRKISANTSFKEQVLEILRNVKNFAPGEFAISGKINAPLTTIVIKNIDNGMIHFPLYANEADKIINSFQQSPYGKGTETLVDTSVRNSWQLDPDEFEITNPTWSTFVQDTLLPQIKREMFLEFEFSASLYKLLLYKTGSFFKPHRDSEKQNGMFATLVIQLPSHYLGGQLIVSHDGKTKTMDFSSNDVENSFSTFFTAFYCDCQHEIRPVTEGYRLCLIYNLISNKSTSVPVAPRRHELENQLVNLIQGWKVAGKLVYALKHKYSEANLSFENLKTTDKAIANFLLYIAKATDLQVFLSIFCKESSGQGDGTYGGYGSDSDDFDSNDDDFCHYNSYSVKKLTSVSGSQIVSTSYLKVNFDKEVIPEDCFQDIEPYKKTSEPTGNAGMDVCKYYRSAAIVIFPKEFFLTILKNSGASSDDVDSIFLKEYETYRQVSGNDENKKDPLLRLAIEVVTCTNKKPMSVINAILALKNVKLIQLLFTNGFSLNENSIIVVENVCDKYGWEGFSKEIIEMFNKLARDEAVHLLQLLIGDSEVENCKKIIFHNILDGILSKCKDQGRTHSSWYVRPPTLEEKMQKRKQEQAVLLKICQLAPKLSYDMLQFAKSKSLVVFVPVLLQLVNEKTQKLSDYWLEIARHFITLLEVEAAAPSTTPTWRRNVQSNCSCTDCNALYTFLRSDAETIQLKMGKQRRRHIHEKMNYMDDISHETNRGGHIGVLVIKKTMKTGFDDFEKKNLSIKLLEQLRTAV